MTPTEKQKCIAEQAVYGDLKGFTTGVVLTMYLANLPMYINEGWKPILRPLSDLTKEITHKGYNDDKPFIPLVELATKILGKDKWEVYGLDVISPDRDTWYRGLRFDLHGLEVYNSEDGVCDLKGIKLIYFDLLHLWHFDTRNLIESGEAIDVNTLDINPYEV